MKFQQYDKILQDHPCLSGHFPGNPIVPGVVILDSVRSAIKEWLPEYCISGFSNIKFLNILRPEQEFLISVEQQQTTCRFECSYNDKTIAQGNIQLGSI